VPAQHRELAGGRDDRDLHPAPRADAFIERAQGTWVSTAAYAASTSRLDEHPAGMRATVSGDSPVAGGLPAGLTHPRVEPEV